MGTGALRRTRSPTNNEAYSTERNQTTNITMSKRESCESCFGNFSIFKRKKKCMNCGRIFCSSCVLKYKLYGNGTFSQCKKCKILMSGNFTQNDLSSWKIRDLRSFLMVQDIPTNQCKEKGDLIGLLLEHFSHHFMRSTSRQNQHEADVQQLAERMRLENMDAQESSVSQGDTAQSNSGEIPSQSDLILSEISPQSTEASIQNPRATVSDNPQVTVSDNPPVNVSDNPPVTVSDNPQVTVSDNPPVTVSDNPEQNNSPSVNRKRTTIDCVTCEEDIEELGIRDLKDILITSFISFKGICEKEDLKKKVVLLYKDVENNKERESEESEICKICMDAVIDCVLLECGHMVSCTQCGKQLAECPICRQYVVRAVHVFRS